jgi:vacuolar-type H+-ATPase subunit I/STV1
MSEFLQNLRAKQNKRYDGNRRQYANPQYQDRRNGKDARKQQQALASAVETLSSSLSENLPAIKNILEGISSNQQRLAKAEERRAHAEERKAEVMENLLEFAKQVFGSGVGYPVVETVRKNAAALSGEKMTPTDINKAVEEVAATSENDGDYGDEYLDDADTITRDDVLNMICGLREEGHTYDQIAKQLEDENIPTFSGKGKWRGQTIHRLYQKMNS